MAVAPDEFREVIGRFATGVTVITASADGVPLGTTVSAVSSVSLEPAMVLVCLNETSVTGQAVARTGRFAVNILGEDAPDLAARFATKGEGKFDGVRYEEGAGGVPLLDGALATLQCRVCEEARGGTHTVFIAEVEAAAGRPGPPLGYFRGRFGRFVCEQDEAATADLRQLILSGDLPAGAPLTLEALAARLDVPRGTVYHALTKLSGEGLVRRSADGGYMTPAASRDAVLDALPALFSIWLGAMQLTVAEATSQQLEALRRRVDDLRPTAPGEWGAQEFDKARAAFEETLLAIAGSAALQAAWDRANLPLSILLREQPELDHADYEELHRRYAAIFDAYTQRDAEALAAALRAMMDHARELIQLRIPA